MKKRLLAFCSYTIFWIVFFFFARLFFLLVQYKSSFPNTASDLLGTFLHGVKLDISTTGYYLLLPLFAAIPGLWFNGKWFSHFMKWYSYILIGFSSIIIVSDSSLYTYWGFRMDYTPMLYLRTPGEAMASVSTPGLITYFATITLIAFLFIYVYNLLIDRLFKNFERVQPLLPAVLFFMVLWGALIIPIRGGFGVAPINAGSVYFSNKMFLNHAAINAVWNVGTTAFTQKPVKNPYEFTSQTDASALASALTRNQGTPVKVLNSAQPNILMIVLESFSSYLVGPLGGDENVTPNLNGFINEGILFTNFYASGPRTDKAMPAILNGYPAQPAQSIIKEPKKTQTLPGLVRILNDKGYNSSFWYGGEINFANFNSFVIGLGFHEIVTKKDFDQGTYNSKWGVHDHILFNEFRSSLNTICEPFFKVVLTLSSHEPFDVPMEPVFEGGDDLAKYKNSVYYADSTLGSFIRWAKTTDWWKNTLVILVADHCCRISGEMPVYSQEIFKIPMLWMGGAVPDSGIKINKLGSQVDIPITLLKQLDLTGNFPFSKDLLSKESESFAFYTYNEGFGFICDSSAVIYDQKLGKPVLREGIDPDTAEKNGKAYLQVLFDDYLKR